MRCKYSMPFTLRVWHWCCVWFMGVLIQTTFCCLLASWVCVCVRRTAESISIYGHIQKNLYQFLISVIIGHGPSNTFIAQLNFCCIRIYIYCTNTRVCEAVFPFHWYTAIARPLVCIIYLLFVIGLGPCRPNHIWHAQQHNVFDFMCHHILSAYQLSIFFCFVSDDEFHNQLLIA